MKKKLLNGAACLAAALIVLGAYNAYLSAARIRRTFISACTEHAQVQAIINEYEQQLDAYIASLPGSVSSKAALELANTLGDAALTSATHDALDGLRDAAAAVDADARVKAVIRSIYEAWPEQERKHIPETALESAFERIKPRLAEIFKAANERTVLTVAAGWE